jgi:putative transcriptional regulator
VIAAADPYARPGEPGLALMSATAAAMREAEPLGAGDRLGGALLEAEAPVAMGAGALGRALADIDALETLDQRMNRMAREAGRRLSELATLPGPAREAAFAAIESGERWTFAGPGVRRLKLDTGGDALTEIFRLEPGAGAPRHDHQGLEYTLVLTGAFHDGHSLYGPGEIGVGRPGFTHNPVAQPGAVCYALAVSWGEPQFDGLLGLVQKLTRH